VLPCDALAAAGTPCKAAYSLTRALYATYNGNLFQLIRTSDSATLNVGVITAGGNVNTSGIAAFCAATTCSFNSPVDQTGNNNTLPGVSGKLAPYQTMSFGNGAAWPIIVGSDVAPVAYRNRASTTGIPTGAATTTEFYVRTLDQFSTNGTGDFGNMEATVANTGTGHMFALLYSNYNAQVQGSCGIDRENGDNSAPCTTGSTNGMWPVVAHVVANYDGTNYNLFLGNASTDCCRKLPRKRQR